MFRLVSPVVPWVAKGMESPGRLPAADAGAQGCRRQLGKEKPAPCRGFSCCGVGLFGMLKGLPSFHGTCEAHGMAREIKGQGQLMAPSQLRRYPRYRTVAVRRKCNFN